MRWNDDTEFVDRDLETHALFEAATQIVVDELQVSSQDIAIAKAQLQSAVGRNEARPRFTVHRPVRTMQWIAAGLVAAVLFLGTGWHFGLAHVNRLASTEMLTYMTANGQRATVVLPDGSRVALSVASRLDVPADYARGNRALRLSGEAVFTIAHRDGAPFTIQAGPSTTRVLGTTFGVRYYPTDSSATVVVLDGKVAVRSSVVTAAQQATIGSDGLVVVRSASAAQLAMNDDVLTIEGKSLPDAILDLDRWYNVDIRLGDTALFARGVDGKFAAGSLADLTEILEFTLNVRVERNGRVLTIFPR